MERNIDFRANGKLLLAGEYLVLAGAKALALPLKFGQHLQVKEISDPVFRWTSSQPGCTWLSCEFEPAEFKVLTSDHPHIASKLRILLRAARKLNPSFPVFRTGISVNVEANYPVKWGLGSSSTLISLVAKWAEVNPFSLFRQVSDGSGYDIACADHSVMIFYRLNGNNPEITETKPGKALRDWTYFVNLGKKQDSRKEVNSFLSNRNFSPGDISYISDLSVNIGNAQKYDDLYRLVREHERTLSRILKRESIESNFKEFPGTVKSLGAWGGDFAMFVSDKDPMIVRGKLNQYDLKDIFVLDEIKAA